MLLSRFWYIVLGASTALAVAAAMLAQSVINARYDENLNTALRRDREVVNALLKLEARERLDRIAFITIDAKVGNLLREAQGVTDSDKLAELNGGLKEALRGHITSIVEAARTEGKEADAAKQLEPDIVFALDADGRIIAQLGPLAQNPPGAGLGTYPLIERALQGYLRDDVWVYDRRVYRMAARPVVAGSDYAGAIVHGYRLDAGLAQRLAEAVPGATVTFFYGDSVLGSYSPPDAPGGPLGTDLVASLQEVTGQESFRQGQRTEPIDLQNGARAVFSPIVGSAASAGVGYAVGRARTLVTDPMTLFEEASDADVANLPWPLLAAMALLLSGFGLLFVYLERDRHISSLSKKTAEIAKGERDRLIITEWRGRYRKLADQFNQAIDHIADKAGQMAPARKKANLDEILGPTPEASSTPFFGFASEEAATGTKPVVPPKPSAPGAEAPVKPPAAPQGAGNLTPAAAPSPGNATLVGAPAPPALSPPAKYAPQPAAARVQPRPAPPHANGSAHPARPAPAPHSNGNGNGASFDEDAHWRDIYAQYVATRKQCGESVDNLTFEKFGVTLKKTRDQIVEKHGVKGVRFSVQIKEGKAALKALPLKK